MLTTPVNNEYIKTDASYGSYSFTIHSLRHFCQNKSFFENSAIYILTINYTVCLVINSLALYLSSVQLLYNIKGHRPIVKEKLMIK